VPGWVFVGRIQKRMLEKAVLHRQNPRPLRTVPAFSGDSAPS
jgi:hypothetical protein